MSIKTLEKAINQLERKRRPQRQSVIVWFYGEPLHGLPAERDPDIEYFHIVHDTPDWREQWERIPVKNRQSAGA